MERELDLSVLHAANGCSDHVTDVKDDEVADVLITGQWCSCEEDGRKACGSYCDSSGVAIYRLCDDSYAVVTEWGDTTGHG